MIIKGIYRPNSPPSMHPSKPIIQYDGFSFSPAPLNSGVRNRTLRSVSVTYQDLSAFTAGAEENRGRNAGMGFSFFKYKQIKGPNLKPYKPQTEERGKPQTEEKLQTTQTSDGGKIHLQPFFASFLFYFLIKSLFF